MTAAEIEKKYEIIKDNTRRFSQWSEMDAFIRELQEMVEDPSGSKPAEPPRTHYGM